MLSFSLVMTKNLKFLTALIALTLATPALAQGPGVTPPPMGGGDATELDADSPYYVITLHWYNIGESVETGFISAPLTYADGKTPLSGDEVMAGLFVIPQANVTFEPTEIPFTINADCTVSFDETKVERVAWAPLSMPGFGEMGIGIDPEKPGYPTTYIGWSSGELQVPLAWPYSAGDPVTAYLYLVTFDTWAWDPEAQAYQTVNANKSEPTSDGAYTRKLPSAVTHWNATQLIYIPVSPTQPANGPKGDVAMGLTEEAYNKLITTAYRGSYLSCAMLSTSRAPTLETAIVDGQELSGVELEAALKPTISGMVATTISDEDGAETPAFTFDFTPAPLPGLSTYTLYTATDLAGPWEPFDKVLEKKGLAIPSGMRYTTLRIDGEESVLMTIPRLEKDPTRFYRLQGDVEVVTTGQEGE